MKHEEIDKLMYELNTLKQYKGNMSKLEPLIGQAAQVVGHFNEVNSVQAEAIAEWAHENDDFEKSAEEAMKTMQTKKLE